jgi:hypothetical protein
MITEKINKKPIIAEMREVMRRMNYAYKTENTYCDWVKRFIKFSGMKDRSELFKDSESKVETFLNPVFFTFSITHRNLAVFKINILHTQTHQFRNSQSTLIGAIILTNQQ